MGGWAALTGRDIRGTAVPWALPTPTMAQAVGLPPWRCPRLADAGRWHGTAAVVESSARPPSTAAKRLPSRLGPPPTGSNLCSRRFHRPKGACHRSRGQRPRNPGSSSPSPCKGRPLARVRTLSQSGAREIRAGGALPASSASISARPAACSSRFCRMVPRTASRFPSGENNTWL